MREIKFRAWDKRTDQMFSNDMLLESGRQLVIFAKRMRPDLPDMQNAKGGLLLPIDDKEIISMQYTGLRDKNGKEIYEGDIVIGDAGIECAVDWDKENARFHANGIRVKQVGIPAEAFVRREVIGNIYENPELLGGETE
jgi:uncharacterized phage protein (TIGR01671 family)